MKAVKGLDMNFMQTMVEAADKTGFSISAVGEERCYNGEMRSQICDAGTEYTGAVIIRLTPKAQPCPDENR